MNASFSDQSASALPSLARRNTASAYGLAMVASSAMPALPEFGLEAGQQLRVRLGVHLALEDLLGAGHRQHRYLCAQRLLGAEHLLLDLGLRGRDDSVGLGLGRHLGFFDHAGSTFLGLG